MLIGVNLLAFKPNRCGGIEVYVRGLLAALAAHDSTNQYVCFTNADNHSTFDIPAPNFRRVPINVPACPQFRRILWEQTYLPLLARRHRLDVLHSPSYTCPLATAVPSVVTICDMLYKAHPEAIGRAKLAFWRVFVPLSVRRCRKVITISESSKRDIVRYLGIPKAKVAVTPLSLDERWCGRSGAAARVSPEGVCGRYGIRPPYLLASAATAIHKNPQVLIRALKKLRQSPATSDLQLVITGNDQRVVAGIRGQAAREGLHDHVVLPGFVATEDLRALYAGAVVYAAPSYFEGFGLTALEAMASDAPLIVSNRASLPEVAGDAALIIDPDDSDAMAASIHRIATDPLLRRQLIRRGRERLQTFSWERTARLTLAAYIQAARPAPRRAAERLPAADQRRI